MSIKVIDTIEPKNAGDFPIVDDRHVKGGAHVVADHAARDAITTAFRKAGMVVVTQNDGLSWELGADLSTWYGGGGDLGRNLPNPTVVGLQGVPVAAHAGEPDGDVLALITAAPTFSNANDLHYDSTAGLVWVADQASTVLRALNPVTMVASITATVGPYLPGVRRIVGDSSYVYVCDPQGVTGRTVMILNKSTGAIVGLIKMPAGSQGRDLALDGLGFLWVMDRHKGVRKYNISSVVASYPTPYSTEAANNLVQAVNGHTICYGAGYLWVGDDSTPIHQIDGTGTWIATFDSGPDANFSQHIGMTFAKGMVWSSTDWSSLRRYDPTTFPSPACMSETIAPEGPFVVRTLSPTYDPYTDTILAGNELSDRITRWSAVTSGPFAHLETFPIQSGSQGWTALAIPATQRIWLANVSRVEIWTDVNGSSSYVGNSVTRLAYTTAGGGITIYDEGGSIGGNPHTALNFVGAGVTASDSGGGLATITIPGGSTPIVEVANFLALAGISDAALPSGALAWVATLKDWFKLDHSSTRTVDTPTTSATLSGIGRWLRTNTPHVFWQEQPAWFIDSGTGNDENAGTGAASKLQTHAELVRRVGHGYVPLVDVTVTVTSTAVGAIYVPFRPLNTFVYYVGTQTSLGSTTTTAYTGKNASTNQPFLLTTTNTSFFSSSPNALFVFSAPYANYAFWTVTGTGTPGQTVCTNIARLTAGSAITDSSPQLDEPTVFDTLGAARTLNAMSLTTVPYLMLPVTDSNSSTQYFVGQTKQPYVFQNFEFTQSLPEPVTIHHRATFFQCLFPALTTVDSDAPMTIDGYSQFDALTKLVNCNCNQYRADLASPTQVMAGRYTGLEVFGKTYLTNGVFSGTGTPALYVHTGAEVIINDFWSWNWSTFMVLVQPHASVYINGIWGSSTNAGSYALRIESEGLVQANVSALLGVARNGVAQDFVLGQNSGGGLRITCRAFDDSVGTYTAARSLTFALWTTTVAGGGFGRNVVDPVTGAAFTYR